MKAGTLRYNLSALIARYCYTRERETWKERESKEGTWWKIWGERHEEKEKERQEKRQIQKQEEKRQGEIRRMIERKIKERILKQTETEQINEELGYMSATF